MNDEVDELRDRLIAERRRVGRGSLRSRRELWRFCRRAYDEWLGIHAIADVPSLVIKRLSSRELAAWVRLAEELPAVARDVLALQQAARARNQRVSLRELRWSPERVAQLAELLRFALIGSRDELLKAKVRHAEVTRDVKQFANGENRVRHAAKMIDSLTRAHETLVEALHALTKV
jgi:hypothetical protein